MTSDNDPDELIGGLHTNLTAVAEAVGAVEVENSDSLKALGAALSGNPEAAQEELKDEDGDEERDVEELAVESFELSLKIADALDVSEENLVSGTSETERSRGLDPIAKALGGR